MGDYLMIVAWVGAVLWPVALGFGLWRGLRKARGPGALGWTAIALVTVFWGLGIRAFIWEPETLVVRRVEVTSRMWTGSPLRIGVISDTHMGSAHMSVDRLKSVVADMNAERPDIVLLLGDYIGGHTLAAERSEGDRATAMSGLPPFAGLKAPLGVYAVLGNHDWWFDGEGVAKALREAGVKVLENTRERVERPGGAFWIGGLSDYDSLASKPSYIDTLKDLPAGEPVIVMTHAPDAFAAAPESVALTVAGHTHCGQVNLPILGRLGLPSPGSKKWPCGLYDDRGHKLYVTGGVGTSILPVRFLQPPEIGVLTLRGLN